MEYRVYDTELREWVKDDVYLRPDGSLFKIKQSLFGMVKMPLSLSADRYVYHKNIRLFDSKGKEIFEGDYIKAHVGKIDENDEDKTEIGLVTFAEELSAYIILCVNSDVFYTLGTSVSSEIEVIGNVFDGYEK